MSDVNFTAREVLKWSVEEVTEFVESLGFSNKSDVVNDQEIDGAKLLGFSVEDLKKAGFLGLQAKKIKNSLPVPPIPVFLPPKKSNDAPLEASAPPLSNSFATDTGSSSHSNPTYANSGTSSAINPAFEKSAASSAESTAASAAQSDEMVALKLELKQMKEQMARLLEKDTPKIVPIPPPAIPATSAEAPNRVTVPGFCAGCVIEGTQVQTLTITLAPGQTVVADPGAMVHMSPFMEMNTKADKKNAVGRFFTGQGIFQAEFTYKGPQGTTDTLCLTPDFPGQIIPVDVSRHGGHVVCQKQSLLCNAPTLQVKVEFTKSLGAGFFGGEGFVLQGLLGSGMAFLNARGSVIAMELRANERRVVATGCLVAFAATVQYTVKRMPGLKNALFGGEGLFVTELVGPGTVWMESHDMSRLYLALNSSVND